MTGNIPWDEEEALILLDALTKVLNQELDRNEAVNNVSRILRARLEQKGVSLNDAIRNPTGISFQMYDMEYALTGNNHNFSAKRAPSILFKNTAELYLHERPTYEHRLQGAISSLKAAGISVPYLDQPATSSAVSGEFSENQTQMISESNSINESNGAESQQDAFFAWLGKKVTPAKLSDLYFAYYKLDEYCSGNSAIHRELFVITDLRILYDLEDKLQYDSECRMRFGARLYLVRLALQWYVEYICQMFPQPEVQRPVHLKEPAAKKSPKEVVKADNNKEKSDRQPTNHVKRQVAPTQEKSSVSRVIMNTATVDRIPEKKNHSAANSEKKVNHEIRREGMSNSHSESLPDIDEPLFRYLRAKNVTYVDKRAVNGNIWIKEGPDINTVVDECLSRFGVQFRKKSVSKYGTWWTYNRAEEEENLDPLLKFLKTEHVEFIDKRDKDGGLWIKGGSELFQLTQQCKKNYGVTFHYKPVTQTFKGESGWWTVDATGKASEELNPTRTEAKTSVSQPAAQVQKTVPEERKKPVPANEKRVSVKSGEENAYETVLAKHFPKGFRSTSGLDIKKFIRYFNEDYGTDYMPEDSRTQQDFRRKIQSAGVRHEDRIFAAESLLTPEMEDQLFAYINTEFASGKSTLYYRAIFDQFNEEFLEQRIYDEDMLHSYLSHENTGTYYCKEDYISKYRYLQTDHTREVRQSLINYGSPMKFEDLCRELSHLPSDNIKKIINASDEIIYNASGEYFDITLIDLTEEELRQICELIDNEIETRRFVSGKELIELIRRKYPEMLDRFPEYTTIGLRDSIAYYLGGKYSFKSNIISALGEEISTEDVYADFARTHSSFTLEELNVLKNDMNSTIYLETIYENALRINQNKFVSLDQAHFDVGATDKAIAGWCTSDYIPIKEIDSFSSFPYAGFPWTSYLLESYVASFSAQFKLVHTGFTNYDCVGAIVKKESQFEDLQSVLIDALSKSETPLDKDHALTFLCAQGYLSRKRYSDIDQVLIKAKERKVK